MARDRRNYTDEFKQKMVELYNSGKPRAELVRNMNWLHLLYLHGSKNTIILVHSMSRTTAVMKKRANQTPQGKSAAKDGKWYFKASSADHGTKINVIIANADKYPVSAMCQLLDIPRSSLYYHLKNDTQKKKHDDSDLIDLIKEIFKDSRNNYGSRKIKIELAKLGIMSVKEELEVSWRKMA